ncbi:MAG: biotin transporter BioY [Nocardiopsis sp. BM-2018]|nr:MAG: biotin transporter BioY [Nocardiopsis sp. BM-2018]
MITSVGQAPAATPLIERLVRVPHPALRLLTQLALGVALLAALAQLRVVIGPVPVTGQTLGVLLLAAVYGPLRGTASVLAYLGVGAAGLGVFAGGAGGAAAMTGTTAGYLVGFVVAAFVVGTLAQRGWGHSHIGMIGAMALGSLVIYACGVAWLTTFAPDLATALAWGVWPFLLGDALKLSLAVVLVPALWRRVGT